MAKEITRFQGEWRFLSNFWPCRVQLSDLVFPSAEHAYQWSKQLVPSDGPDFKDPGMTPGQAKRAGQRVLMVPDWEQVKKRAMLRVVMAKFVQNENLTALLLATEGAYLEEGNTWHDNYWGACGCPAHIGDGLNYLGRILMMVRDIVRVD